MAISETVVVVPTIREPQIKQFLAAWQWPCEVIVVEDNPEPTFDLDGCTHYSWQDIAADLGHDAWIIPRRTDAIRSYGYWKAWQRKADYIITLDDDCLPATRPTEAGFSVSAITFIEQHLNNLAPKPVERWHSTLDGVYPRGVPYEARARAAPVAISHGLWTNVPDFDSLTQLHYGRAGAPKALPRIGLVPHGQYYPMCGMNVAWRAEYTPLLYFLLMGQDAQGTREPFDRFGDIWAGILSKKVLDHLGIGVWSGSPVVNHSRASNVWANFDKEHAGIKENERFWQWVDDQPLTGIAPEDCYGELAAALARRTDSYWSRVGEAMLRWVALYA